MSHAISKQKLNMFCGNQQRYTNVEKTIRIWSAIDADQHRKHP